MFQTPVRFSDLTIKRFIRISIASVMLLATAVVAPRAATGHPNGIFLIGLYLAFIALIALLRWPVLSLVFTLAGGAFIGYSGPGGINITIVGVAFFIFLWVVEMIVRKRKIELPRSGTTRPALLLGILSLLSFGFGQLPWFNYYRKAPLDAQFGGLAIVLLSLGVFFAVAQMVRDVRWLQTLTFIYIALAFSFVGARSIAFRPIGGLYQYSFTANSMFWTWLVALTFGQAFLNHRIHWFWRMILYVVLGITFYVAYVQAYDWKSGWLPPLVAVAAIILFRYWRKWYVFVAPFAAIPFYLLIMQSIGTEEYSFGTRIDAWLIVMEIAKASPLLGLGFANYYWYTPLFPIRGFAVSFNSHSQYVDLIAQIGFLGFAAFLWLFWKLTKLGWNLREQVPAGFERAYVYGVLGGLAGTVFAAFLVDWVLPFVYNIGMQGFRASVVAWIFLGGLVSLEQILKADAHQIKVQGA